MFNMPFSEAIKELALLACKRRCCLCEEHVHTLVECHHIVQEADGGDNSFDNCIPLCLNCHGRVLSYNQQHPIGNKYRPNELKKRRNNFYAQMNPDRSAQVAPRQEPDILDLTPENLNTLFKDKTEAQVQKQIAPLIGKWMKVSGPLADYSGGRLLLSNHHFPATAFHVWTHFNGTPWTDLLSEMNIGTQITLQGQIAHVDRLGVQLIYCELLDA
jgi:hypothetical protein